MQTQAILFTAILSILLASLIMSFAIFYNALDLGRYFRSLGIVMPLISVLCSAYIAISDPSVGILLGVFGLSSLILNYVMISKINRCKKEGNLKLIHAYPGKFKFQDKQYINNTPPLMAAVVPPIITQTNIGLFVEGETDPIVMPQSTLMEADAEYEMLCCHMQKENDSPYWHCFEVDAIHRKFSAKRILVRLFALIVAITGIVSFAIQGGVNIAGLSINPDMYNYITSLFGGAIGSGIFYGSKQIFKSNKFVHAIFSILFYITLFCFILSLIGF